MPTSSETTVTTTTTVKVWGMDQKCIFAEWHGRETKKGKRCVPFREYVCITLHYHLLYLLMHYTLSKKQAMSEVGFLCKLVHSVVHTDDEE